MSDTTAAQPKFCIHGMPAIIYGKQGCGKTTHAKALAAHYGKTRIVDDWRPGVAIPNNAIALTNVYVEGCIMFGDAMKEAGIPLPVLQPKFCINCAHVKYRPAVDRYPQYGSPDGQAADPVYGYVSPYCSSARMETGACRREGVLFVAKPISGCSCCSEASPAESVVEYLDRPCVKQWLASSLFQTTNIGEGGYAGCKIGQHLSCHRLQGAV